MTRIVIGLLFAHIMHTYTHTHTTNSLPMAISMITICYFIIAVTYFLHIYTLFVIQKEYNAIVML